MTVIPERFITKGEKEEEEKKVAKSKPARVEMDFSQNWIRLNFDSENVESFLFVS